MTEQPREPDRFSECSVGELEVPNPNVLIKIKYTDPKLRLFRTGTRLSHYEHNDLVLDLYETRRLRAELEQAD